MMMMMMMVETTFLKERADDDDDDEHHHQSSLSKSSSVSYSEQLYWEEGLHFRPRLKTTQGGRKKNSIHLLSFPIHASALNKTATKTATKTTLHHKK